MSAGEFIPAEGGKDCSEKEGGWGIKSTRYDYIWKGDIDEDDYPEDACDPRYHGNAQIDNIKVNTTVTGDASINVSGVINSGSNVTCPSHSLSSKKNFDIPHPTKKGWRLRHTCLEGPENALYFRGRLTNSDKIELPEYWSGLIDPETITVSLTQIGSSQDLIVDKIPWGKTILLNQEMPQQLTVIIMCKQKGKMEKNSS